MGPAGSAGRTTERSYVDVSSDARGYCWATIFVPERMSQVVGVATRGAGISVEPLARMAFLWWPDTAGSLATLVADTPAGPVDLLDGP